MQLSEQAASVDTRSTEISKGRLWTGRVLAGLITLFNLFDAWMKFAKPAPVIHAFAQSGWPVELSAPIGAILLASTALFVIPRTTVLGGLLLTGYLGGAVATNLRLENPLFSETLFPVYVGIFLWASLLLQHPRLGEYLPFLKPVSH